MTKLRDLFIAEKPKHYEQIDDDNVRSRWARWKLTEFLAQEMESHRRRQTNMFRDAIIVIGLVTWATYLILSSLPADDHVVRWVGILSTLICLVVGASGSYMIFVYRQRIYHMRKNREDLVRGLRPQLQGEIAEQGPVSPGATWLFSAIGPPTSSWTYVTVLSSATLIAMTFNINACFVLPGCMDHNPTSGADSQPNLQNVAQTESQPTIAPTLRMPEDGAPPATDPPLAWYVTPLIAVSAVALAAGIVLSVIALRQGATTHKMHRRHLAVLAAVADQRRRPHGSKRKPGTEPEPPFRLRVLCYEQLLTRHDLGAVDIDDIQAMYCSYDELMELLSEKRNAGKASGSKKKAQAK